jgi:hypothetical protein
MNTNNQSFESMTGIKQLRSKNFDSKPLFVSAVSAVQDALAFVGRMATCNNEIQMTPAVAKSTQEKRFVLNSSGKWALAKD